MADLTDLDRRPADYGHPMAMAEALLRQEARASSALDGETQVLDSPPAGGTADAAVSNTAPSGGEGSTPSLGTIRMLDERDPHFEPGGLVPVIGHKVLSARVNLDDRHFHVADLVGDAFYRDGVRMKNAVCRTCGETMEARRA